MKKIRINMLSKATSVDGQGVGSAYTEQVNLVKSNADIFDVTINKYRGHFDIYHLHTINPQYYFRMNKHHINVAYVHFLPTTLDGSIKLPKLIFKVFKRYVVKLYKKADEIVVVNSIFKKPLIELGIPEDHITYIPNFVSKEKFHAIDSKEILQIKAEYKLDPKKFVVLGCGQVQTRKGVLDFIEVAKHCPDVQFIWAGGFSFGPITDGYKELKEVMENPPVNVKFIGLVSRDKMNGIFNISNLLFMPSFAELFPMSILEAVNSDKPILLRDLDLYRDILFEKYLRGSTVEDWVKTIQELRDNPQFYKTAQDDSKYLASYYSKDNVNAMWRDYYTRIYDKYKDVKRLKK